MEEMLQWIYDGEYAGDQIGLREYTKVYPEKIYYDLNSEIISNTLPLDFSSYIKDTYFRHYPAMKTWKMLQYTYDKDLQKYVKNNLSSYPIEIEKSDKNNLNFVLGFSIFGILICMIPLFTSIKS